LPPGRSFPRDVMGQRILRWKGAMRTRGGRREGGNNSISGLVVFS